MFNFGFSELLIIAVIALIFIGPKQLPEVARVVGRLLNEFKRATGDITSTFVDAREEADQFLRQTKQKIADEVEGAVGDVGVNLLEENQEKKNNDDGDKA